MIKESERLAFSAFFIINEKTVFGGEGFALTEFGSKLQAIFIIRKYLDELAKQDGAIDSGLKLNGEDSIRELCNDLGVPRQNKFLDILERQFITIVTKRQDAAVRSVQNFSIDKEIGVVSISKK